MRRIVTACILGLAALLAARPLLAHCEIPCGIYNDELRAALLAEHIGTIEKSMKQIQELSQAGDKNYNQLVRWVQNKDHHADLIQDIVTQYFMTQRVKPADPKDAEATAKYVTQLTLLHQMLIAAMKAKQTTDLEHVAKLRDLLGQFKAAYFGPEAKGHSH
jgi:nickel superoxide dismutase